MSPPTITDWKQKADECFSNITTILYISCCYTNTDDIRHHFNTRNIGHTSSVVREAAHKIVDFFHCSGDGINYINNEIMEIIMKIPRVASNEYVSQDIATYIIPYIVNQLLSQYNDNISNFNLQETHLE
jgi:hypothetical protein